MRKLLILLLVLAMGVACTPRRGGRGGNGSGGAGDDDDDTPGNGDDDDATVGDDDDDVTGGDDDDATSAAYDGSYVGDLDLLADLGGGTQFPLCTGTLWVWIESGSLSGESFCISEVLGGTFMVELNGGVSGSGSLDGTVVVSGKSLGFEPTESSYEGGVGGNELWINFQSALSGDGKTALLFGDGLASLN